MKIITLFFLTGIEHVAELRKIRGKNEELYWRIDSKYGLGEGFEPITGFTAAKIMSCLEILAQVAEDTRWLAAYGAGGSSLGRDSIREAQDLLFAELAKLA